MQLSNESIVSDIEEFVRTQFDVPADDTDFNSELHLWEAGYIDSLGVIELIAFLEEKFGVTIPERQLFSLEFTYINGIAQIVSELRAASKS